MNELPLIESAAPGGRMIWSGRHAGVAGGLDGFNCDQNRLHRLLDVAAELVVLDAPSFPWDSLRSSEADVPLVVALPEEYDASAIVHSLAPLFELFSPFDRLLEHRSAIRAEVEHHYGVEPSVWVPVDNAALTTITAAIARLSAGQVDSVPTEFGTFRAKSDDLITHHLRTFGAHQRGTLNVVLALLAADDTVIDLGAHIGTFAIPIAQRAVAGRVLAVEASAPTAMLLRENVAAAGLGTRVAVERCAVDSDRGYATTTTAPGNTGATMFRPTASATFGDIETTTLDALAASHQVDNVSLIKLDIEGAELDALRGGSATIERWRPIIVCEVSEPQLSAAGASVSLLDQWFSENEYVIFEITGDRNTSATTWTIAQLTTLADRSEAHTDVVAVPAERQLADTMPLAGDASDRIRGSRPDE